MTNESNIYFVEEVTQDFDENNSEAKTYTVVLLRAYIDSEILQESQTDTNFIAINVSAQYIDRLKEGTYIYYDKGADDNLNFENANQSSVAKRNNFLNNRYRALLINTYSENFQPVSVSPQSRIFTYHINVGHGNCSIVVIQEESAVKIWMIDCSNFDFLANRSYQLNIDDCFNHILNRFSLSDILIEKMFLTHPHYDHYSGIISLINQRKINNQTEFYINLHYSMPSKNYTRLLYSIFHLGCPVIEPLPSVTSTDFQFWHPLQRTIRTRTAKYNGQVVNVQSKANNASTVFQIKLSDKSILFTGDIETPSWNTITSCVGFLQNTDFYMISHHGSLNGHLRTVCPASRLISNLSHCNKIGNTAILMGRDRAFSGIYSPQVLTDFGTQLVCSEKDPTGTICRFLEIDWNANTTTWI